jgi:hypothetical protein
MKQKQLFLPDDGKGFLRLTKPTYKLPYCEVIILPWRFIRKKPWFHKRKHRRITAMHILQGNRIYIAEEVAADVRETELNKALAKFATVNFGDDIHIFYSSLLNNNEYEELANVIKQKRLK